MSWIALKMLTGDKAKFAGIVMGLTFASLLIYQQGSIFWGLMLRTAGQITDIRGADLWVMDANVRYVDDVKPMIENNLYRVRGVEGVRWAVPLYKGNARAKINSIQRVPGVPHPSVQPGSESDDPTVEYDPRTGKATIRVGSTRKVIEQVILLGLDDSSMVGAPPDERILAGSLTDLRKPDAVIIDFNRLEKLFPGDDIATLKATFGKPLKAIKPAQRDVLIRDYGRVPLDASGNVASYDVFIGRDLEMNDHRAIIVGVCEATRTFQSNAVIYTKYSRAKNFVPQERKILSYILAKTEDGRSPQAVAEDIRKQTGLRARTSKDFTDDTINYYLLYTGIPINFGITAFLGFFVGTAIAGQTFYNFTLENLKQFGALKAMGATNVRIVGMILLQAAVVGFLGYGLGCGLGALFGISTTGGELAFETHPATLPVVGVAIIAICILSSILCIRRVMVLEPAIVFRG
jgi:putative ABC transport system permease protein